MAPPNPPKPALPGLPVDPNPQLDHVEMQRRINLASEISQRDGISFSDALISLYANPSPSAAEDPLYDEVMADSDQLDSHIRALMVDRQLGYVESLDWLQQTAERCWDVSGPLTLSSVLSRGGTTLSRIHTLMAADDERVRALSTADATRDQEVDEGGHVLLPADVDPDDLLADEKAPKKAFRRARELGVVDSRYGDDGQPVGEGSGWETFLQEWKVYTDKGWDLVETLRREQQGGDQALDALARVEESQRVEAKVRHDRAEAAAEKEKAAEKLKADAKQQRTGR